MILAELVELARREGLVDDPDYEPKSVSYVVVVGEGGALRGIVSTLQPSPGGKGKPRPARKSVPRETVRSSKTVPQFLWDKAEYVFGVDPKDERPAAQLARRRDVFRAAVEAAAQATADPAVADVAAFLAGVAAAPPTLDALLGWCAAEKIEPNAVFVFRHDSDPEGLVSDRPLVRDYLRQRRSSGAAESVQCLVTGQPAAPIDIHPRLKRVPGGNSSGVALVSFNNTAFESYGLARNANAPIGRPAAEAVAAALNRLLDRGYPDPRDGTPMPSRRVDIADDTAILYWSRGSEELLDVFAGALDASPEQVRALYEAPHAGRAPALEDPAPLFALALSGEMARAKVRGWFQTTVGAALCNVRQHFDDIDVVLPAFRAATPLPLWKLLTAIAPLGDRKRLPPNLAAAVFAAILDGRPYPRALLEHALRRIRVEKTRVTPERAALVKGYLVRNRRKGLLAATLPEVTRAMDSESTNAPYLLGRLFATLEKLQEEAVNPQGTIGDRFFGAASSGPGTVLPRLLQGAKHHLAKARRRVFFDKLIQQILEPLPARPFPARLTLEEQGLFALGYYHQRQTFFEKKPDETNA